jgi:hypothetical protein
LYRLGNAHGTIKHEDATSGGIALKMLTLQSGLSLAGHDQVDETGRS